MNSAGLQRSTPSRASTWRAFGVLMVGALVGAAAILPYGLALAPPPPTGLPLPILLALSVVQTVVLCAIAAAVGLRFGPSVGLGVPLLQAWLAGDRGAPREFVGWLPLAAGLGAAAGVVVLLLDVTLFAPNLPALASAASPRTPAPWQGLLASLYGGIDEEILLRLGVMTLLAWLLLRLSRAQRPSAGHLWLANALAAALFGAGHLPATAAIVPLSGLIVVRALVLNGLAGVIFGWLYWRRGLLVAMASHFCADLVLHVLTPLTGAPR